MATQPDTPNAGTQERDPRQDAMQDESITQRLEKNPSNVEAKLDHGLDETMDGSDPVSVTQPGLGDEPAPSSGYDAEAEASRAGS